MASILVTGGAGFIGCHTVATLLDEGHSVRILDVLDPQIHDCGDEFPASTPKGAERLRGDVRVAQDVDRALDGVDAVYHFAALTGVGQSMYEIRSYVDTNCGGTATVLERIARRRKPLERFVLASSRAVYGEGTYDCPTCGTVYPPPRERAQLEAALWDVLCPTCRAPLRSRPTTEQRPLAPLSIYGWTKLQQEQLCRHVCLTYDIPLTVLRYFNVYGSGQSLKNPYTGVVSIFYSRLMADQPISLYESGLAGRDFVHVSDVVQANLLALNPVLESAATFNVGTGAESTILDVAQTLARACDREPQLVDRGEYRAGDVRACFADLTASNQILGYQPRVPMAAGMAEFAAWAHTQHSVDLYENAVSELQRHNLFGTSRS